MERAKLINSLDKIIEWSLYLLIFFIFGKTIIEGCILLAFIAWGAKKILTRDFTLKKTSLNNLLFAFFIVTLISFVNAEFKLLFMRSLVSKCLKYIILYFIIVETINSETKFKNLIMMAFVSAAIIALDSYIQYFIIHYDLFRLYPTFKYAPMTDPGRYAGLPTGPFPFPNDLSAWMLIILMPALSLFIWGVKESRPKIILGLFLFPFLFLFYLAKSRSAWLGFFAAFFCILFMQSKKIFFVFLVILLSTIFVVLLLPKEKTVHILEFASLKDRIYMWRIGWEIFKEHPIIGNGLNMFFSKFMEYRDDAYKGKRGSYAHNGFLQMAAEIGIIGLGVFFAIIFSAFKNAYLYIKMCKDRFYRAFSLGLSGGIFAFLIHSFFDTNLQSLPLVILFWFSLAVLLSVPYICLKNISEYSS